MLAGTSPRLPAFVSGETEVFLGSVKLILPVLGVESFVKTDSDSGQSGKSQVK